jgi:cytochrome P450
MLRMYPPVPMVDKESTKNVILNNKYAFSKNEHIAINILGLHYNENIYKNPYEFDPDRFSEENIKNIDLKTCFLPFSGGYRNCAVI